MKLRLLIASLFVALFVGGTLQAQTPFSLSDPEGQELILEELNVHSAIHGMLSLTELEFRFRNPKARRVEGRFNCVLPPDAAISRFAKEVNGHLMEGEVVERLRANQVYEQFLHQMRDPALLEQDQGNRFSARIFPIESNASVRILLSYSALLPMRNGVRTYNLPLRGLPKVNKLTFRALVQPLPGESSATSTDSDSLTHSTADVITMEKRDVVPQHDINLSWKPAENAPQTHLLRAGDFYIRSFRPEMRSMVTEAPHAWLLYVDTSASSAEGAAHRIKALQTMLAALPASDSVRVDAFDQEITTLGNGTAAEMSRRIESLLRARLFLGGTDLAALLRHIGKQAKAHPERAIIIASDLVATLGATERHDLDEAARAIPPRTVLHALILGSREDAAVAKALTAGRGRVIRVPFSESLEARAKEAAADVRRPLGISLDLHDVFAEWVYPTHVDDVQLGDEVISIGKLRAGEVIAGDSTVLSSTTFGPLLEREGWRANLAYLADREATESSETVRQALATQQVKLSIEQRVVIPRTTLLVLESEQDYQRFGLDRRALAQILTVGATGIERLDRQTVALPPRVATDVVKSLPSSRDFRESVAVPAAPPGQTFVEDAVQEVKMMADMTGGLAANGASGFSAEFGRSTVPVQAVPPPESAPPPPRARDSAPPAPRPVPPPAPPPVPAPREERRSDSTWTRHVIPKKEDIAQLQLKLDATPSNRELYNQLSEALAASGDWSTLRSLALQWQPYDPENPQVYEVLGLADENLGNMAEAARANASIIEVAPAKTELLQRAGLLLLRDGHGALAEAPLRHALEVRPDRVNGYRHLALLLWREGRLEEAARVLESATRQKFPQWYGDAQRVVREELGYIYRAIAAKDPSKRNEMEERAHEYAVDLARRDALRVTLAWETDANDVDLHVVDPKGEECFYGHRATNTGLALYEDITQGLGPEVIRTEKLVDGKYDIGVRYFSAGPMGVSRGIVIVMRGDDDVEIRPFRLVEGGGEIRYVTTVEARPVARPSRATADRSRL
jgi:tetratricopeptide (TPR) repeat protein